MKNGVEGERLEVARDEKTPWRKWGPYLSERQWGTVREDYSEMGDYILFHEYFHGENGAGLGASHQTGWTGAVARLIHLFGYLDAATFLAGGKEAAFRYRHAPDGVAAD